MGCLLIADYDVLVATVPERPPPAMKSSCLFGEVSLEIPYETSQLAGRVDREEKVVVVRKHDACVESDSIESLCPTENSYEQTIELSRGSQQESALDGAIRDFDEAASRRNESKATSHTYERRNAAPISVKKKGGT